VARFFDAIVHSKAVPWPELQELLEKATVIVADNVAEYFYSGTDQDYWSLETDFPNLAPPFELFFLEWREPSYFVARGLGRQRIHSRRRNGALFVCVESDEVGDAEAARGCRWVENIWLWTESERAVELLGLMRIKVGPEGSPVRFSDEGYFVASPNPELRTQPPAELFLSLAQPALLTVCFLHCKNVHIETHTPPPAVAKKHRLRYGRPPVTYKTLVIDPLTKVLRNEGKAEEVGLRKALHICRGHFKRFEERPLFGKYKGMWWWESQLRGSLQHGYIKKTYEVHPPKKDGPEH
jgi:hypothetical protein